MLIYGDSKDNFWQKSWLIDPTIIWFFNSGDDIDFCFDKSINLLAYYAEVNRFSSVKRVPLDCYAAEGEFYQLINKVRLHDKQITVDYFKCEMYEVSAQVSIIGRMPIQIPFLDSVALNRLIISTQVGASSVYIPN